jgi:hypothetical protein
MYGGRGESGAASTVAVVLAAGGGIIERVFRGGVLVRAAGGLRDGLADHAGRGPEAGWPGELKLAFPGGEAGNERVGGLEAEGAVFGIEEAAAQAESIEAGEDGDEKGDVGIREEPDERRFPEGAGEHEGSEEECEKGVQLKTHDEDEEEEDGAGEDQEGHDTAVTPLA